VPTAARRGLEHPRGAGRAAGTGTGLHERSWERLAELGVLGLGVRPNGSGGGQGDAVVVMEQMGRVLYHSPYPDTMLAADLIEQAGPDGPHQALLGRVAAGTAVVVPALRRTGDQDLAEPHGVDLRDEGPDRGWRLTGERRFVPFARAADHLVVPAGPADSPSLVLVPPGRPGVGMHRQDDVGRGHFHVVTFADTPAGPGDLVGERGGAAGPYAAALARARIRQAAYLVGMSRGAFEMTLAYAKQRQQFGQKIARFQSITFRLSSMATGIEAVRLAAHHAAWAADRGEDLSLLAVHALAMAADLARHVTTEAIQIHGAIGATEAGEPQRYYRHAAVESVRLGTPVQLRRQAVAVLARMQTVPA
jgi:butyryl-CoA dehydrogenase